MARFTRRQFAKSAAVGLAAVSGVGCRPADRSHEALSDATGRGESRREVTTASLEALSGVVNGQLQGWRSWLSDHHVQGVISECGWPNANVAPDDAPGWNQVGSSWLRQAAHANLEVVSWGSGRVWTPSYILGAFTAKRAETQVCTTQSNAQHMVDVLGRSHVWGTNLSGGERSSVQSGSGALLPIAGGGVFSNGNPGRNGVDYFFPTQADFKYVAAAGVRIVRLPIRWERLQPVLTGPLDRNELGSVLAALRGAAAAGVGLVPELHNGAAYIVNGPTIHTATMVRLRYDIGSVTAHAFADFWSRFSHAVASSPAAMAGLHGYGLMNEPDTMPEAQPHGPNLIENGTFLGGPAGWKGHDSAVFGTKSPGPSARPSLMIVGTGMIGGADSAPIRVTPGEQLLVTGEVLAATRSQQWGVQVDWFHSNGKWISQQNGDWPVDPVRGWTVVSAALTVPSGAATARARFRPSRPLHPGERHYLSNCVIQRATGGLTGPQVWERLSSAAVSAIRGNGDGSTIWVAGHNGQSPVSWLTDHGDGPWIDDPRDATVYDAHHYFDLSAGGAGVYAQPLAVEAGVAVGQEL